MTINTLNIPVRKQTKNIYNDFESYKYEDIKKNLDTMLCNTKYEIEFNKKEGYKTDCELIVKLENELDARIYEYDNINSLLTATYFIWMIDKKRTDIQDLKVFINNEVSYCFDYWQKEYKHTLEEENEELKEKMLRIETALKKYNLTIKKFIGTK